VITVKQKKIFVLALLVALISSPLLLVRMVQSRHNENHPILGMHIPTLTVSTIKGTTFTLTQRGKKNILLFFSVECPHCINELLIFDSLYKQFGHTINIIAISMSNPNKTDALLASMAYPFPIFQSADSALQDSLKIFELPAILYTDEQQILRHFYFGERTMTEERMLLLKFAEERFADK
jgi:peroxiredoxin